jgi:hypothetical protein
MKFSGGFLSKGGWIPGLIGLLFILYLLFYDPSSNWNRQPSRTYSGYQRGR